jgi:hypothetical protein
MLVWLKHICIFLVHVFHEAFYFQTLLKVIPGHRVLSAEIWSRFDFPKNSMWSKVDGVLGILEKCPLPQ